MHGSCEPSARDRTVAAAHKARCSKHRAATGQLTGRRTSSNIPDIGFSCVRGQQDLLEFMWACHRGFTETMAPCTPGPLQAVLRQPFLFHALATALIACYASLDHELLPRQARTGTHVSAVSTSCAEAMLSFPGIRSVPHSFLRIS